MVRWISLKLMYITWSAIKYYKAIYSGTSIKLHWFNFTLISNLNTCFEKVSAFYVSIAVHIALLKTLIKNDVLLSHYGFFSKRYHAYVQVDPKLMEDMLKDQRETSTKLMNMRWRLIEEIFSMIQILPVICILTKVKSTSLLYRS